MQAPKADVNRSERAESPKVRFDQDLGFPSFGLDERLLAIIQFGLDSDTTSSAWVTGALGLVQLRPRNR